MAACFWYCLLVVFRCFAEPQATGRDHLFVCLLSCLVYLPSGLSNVDPLDVWLVLASAAVQERSESLLCNHCHCSTSLDLTSNDDDDDDDQYRCVDALCCFSCCYCCCCCCLCPRVLLLLPLLAPSPSVSCYSTQLCADVGWTQFQCLGLPSKQ